VSWIESHQSLRDHPKKDQLAELLWDPMMPTEVAEFATIGLLHCLWWWAIDFAEDGDLSRFTDHQLAKGCRFLGEGAYLRAALKAAGFLDEDGVLHDWHEYAGKLIQAREKDRQRKAVSRKSDGRPTDGRQTAAVTDLQTNKPLNGQKRKKSDLGRFDFRAAAESLRRGTLSEDLAKADVS